jgi:hypothetical protein
MEIALLNIRFQETCSENAAEEKPLLEAFARRLIVPGWK